VPVHKLALAGVPIAWRTAQSLPGVANDMKGFSCTCSLLQAT
jgi:hypothetical protein